MKVIRPGHPALLSSKERINLPLGTSQRRTSVCLPGCQVASTDESGAFAARQKATAELEKLGELAEPTLRRALENNPSLEQRRRIEPMLAKLEVSIPSSDALRSLRAVRALEHIETAEARRLLRELARGAEGASLTRTAQAALSRTDRFLFRPKP